MPRVKRRPQAEVDILEIWEYIAADSIAQADLWVDDLDRRLDLQATQPKMGREREDLAPGLRSFPFGRYIVFFLSLKDGIDVVRVMHGSLDIEERFHE